MRVDHYDRSKRLIDIAIASGALLVSAPLQLVVAILVRRRMGPPVLFRQDRPGKGERIFEMVKFRSMLEPDAASGVLDDRDRLTEFGAWLRATSLDELPTLWNVLKGDMSLVGPRPLLVSYLDRYSEQQRRRHEVRPGLTGLAQISGRNGLSWKDRFELDVEYVDRRSLRLDVEIMARTVCTVLRREGISGGGSVTMTEYSIRPEDGSS